MNRELLGEIVGKDFYRTEKVNEGHYSKKREDVADVDPKVRNLSTVGQIGVSQEVLLTLCHFLQNSSVRLVSLVTKQ